MRFLPTGFLLLLASTLVCGVLGAPAAAQYYPYGRGYPTRGSRQSSGRNNRASGVRSGGARGGNSAGRRITLPGAKNAKGNAPIDLTTEVQALQERHTALISGTPADFRRADAAAAPVVGKMPLAAQYGYYTTVEDYSRLGTGDQARLLQLARGLGSLGESDRQRFLDSAQATFGPMEKDRAKLQAVRATPHTVCFQIQDVLEGRSSAPAPTPAPAAASAAPAASASPPAKKPASGPAKK